MKKKYILLGLIVLSLLSIIFVGKYVLSNESHAQKEEEYTQEEQQEGSVKLSIKKETDVDTDEEFDFEIVFPKNNNTYKYYLSYAEPDAFALSRDVALEYTHGDSIDSENYIFGGWVELYNKSSDDPAEWTLEKIKIPGVTKTVYTLGSGVETEVLDLVAFYAEEWTRMELYDNDGQLLRVHNREDLQYNSLDSGENITCTDCSANTFASVRFIKNYSPGFINLTEKGEEYIGTFKLKKDENIGFIDLPNNTEYEIYELDKNGNRISVGDNVSDKWILKSATNNSGVIKNDDIEAVFVNESKKYKVTTEVINGEIDDGVEVLPSSDTTITYRAKKGFILKQITVDGNEIDIVNNEASFTFTNINEDHHIKVVYEKEPTPAEPVTPVKEETPKTENVVKRSNTPNTVDKIIIDSELFVISVLVMGICVMLIKRVK